MAILTTLSLSPVTALADEYSSGGWGRHMGYMGEGWGGHMGFMGGGWLMMILWIGLLIFAIVGIIRWMSSPGKKVITTGNAHNILNERYAKGEISKEQFEEMKKMLQ